MIRKAEVKDIARIAEIFIFGKRVAYRSIFHNDYVSFNEMLVVDLANKYYNHPELIAGMLVYDDGIVKGVVNREYRNGQMEICEFYIEPFFKGEGIGSKLITYVMEEAKKLQIKRIFLWVVADNADARRFYEHHNLHASGETASIDGTEEVLMCYDLEM